MHLAKEIGRQKSNSSDKKEGSFSDSFNKDGTHKSGGSAVSSIGGFNSGAGVMVAGIVVALDLALEKAIKEAEAVLEGRLVGTQALVKRVGGKNQEIDKAQKMGEDKGSEFKNIF